METQTVIIPEVDYFNTYYCKAGWQNSVDILQWEHDYVNKYYKIIFKKKSKKK